MQSAPRFLQGRLQRAARIGRMIGKARILIGMIGPDTLRRNSLTGDALKIPTKFRGGMLPLTDRPAMKPHVAPAVRSPIPSPSRNNRCGFTEEFFENWPGDTRAAFALNRIAAVGAGFGAAATRTRQSNSN